VSKTTTPLRTNQKRCICPMFSGQLDDGMSVRLVAKGQQSNKKEFKKFIVLYLEN